MTNHPTIAWKQVRAALYIGALMALVGLVAYGKVNVSDLPTWVTVAGVALGLAPATALLNLTPDNADAKRVAIIAEQVIAMRESLAKDGVVPNVDGPVDGPVAVGDQYDARRPPQGPGVESVAIPPEAAAEPEVIHVVLDGSVDGSVESVSTERGA